MGVRPIMAGSATTANFSVFDCAVLRYQVQRHYSEM